MKVDRVILDKPGHKLDIHHQCQVSHYNHILTSRSFARSHLTVVSEGELLLQLIFKTYLLVGKSIGGL